MHHTSLIPDRKPCCPREEEEEECVPPAPAPAGEEEEECAPPAPGPAREEKAAQACEEEEEGAGVVIEVEIRQEAAGGDDDEEAEEEGEVSADSLYASHTIKELQARLQGAGLPSKGKKADLASRLASHLLLSVRSSE